MPKEFFKMLLKEFPRKDKGGQFILTYSRGELMHVDKLGWHEEVIPDLEELTELSKRTLEGLNYTIRKVECEGGMVPENSTLVEFPDSNHFICFVPKEHGSRSVLINIGWRGRMPMTDEEREKYTTLLKSYFFYREYK